MKNLIYLPHKKIDKIRWDNCLRNAGNALIYGYSFYIDIISPGWDAIVTEDYSAVMPLLWRKKMGIKYLFQPLGIAQSGIYSITPAGPEVVAAFLQKMRAHIKYGNLDLNEKNQLPASTGIFTATTRSNYVLPLHISYEQLQAAYNKDGKKNLRRAAAFEQHFSNEVPAETVLELYRQQYGKLAPNIKTGDYQKLLAVIQLLQEKQMTVHAAVRTTAGELLAAAVFCKDDKRLYYVSGAPTEKGKTYKSMHVLIDRIIHQFAGSSYSLDFEGSDIASVAAFYEKFGPEKRSYLSLFFNDLPAPVRWLK